ncbi:SRPBCC family protein [Mycobacterium sp. CPCC 205372]|uniref:SRPBCC family protein n=1 Tax=Mycobacterium hippophais TaxID=3016340 RepID=A0ABT4PT52_9MYCO|nr:SRPBCC family protein [Mycobacterium hippophais]MCZ8379671.1 SRPBCC family protein [Mycobacterium hippophais]
MHVITVERHVAATPEEVFDWCADSTNYERTVWVLRDTLTQPGRDARYGVGAVRVHTWLIGRFHERITRYDAPRSFDYVVDKSVPPSRHDGGTMEFTPVAGGTLITWTTRVQVALPVAADAVTRILVAPVLRLVFGRILAACAGDLEKRV